RRQKETRVMANPEHLQILKQGVEAWNQWWDQRAPTLQWASFYRAESADLQGADLSQANLQGADLRGADLQGPDRREANLSGVFLNETVFSNTDLTTVQGLETCRHRGPSPLDHRTLARFGPLPLAFLRGCGLPERLIEYLPSLLNEPFQFYSCFISHS